MTAPTKPAEVPTPSVLAMSCAAEIMQWLQVQRGLIVTQQYSLAEIVDRAMHRYTDHAAALERENAALVAQLESVRKITGDLIGLMPANPKLPLIWEIKERVSALSSAAAAIKSTEQNVGESPTGLSGGLARG